MPIYEYISIAPSDCDRCNVVFEIMQSILSEPLSVCPKCNCPVVKIVSLPVGFIDKNRQVNQYNEVKYAKYWRDQNGNRHRVTPSDGDRKSPTVSKKVTRSPEEIAKLDKYHKNISKKRRTANSYNRFIKNATKKR